MAGLVDSTAAEQGPGTTQGAIHATIRMPIAEKNRKEALIILGSFVERARLDEGCIICRLYQDVQEPRALTLAQLWQSADHLNRHLASGAFRTVLLVIEMSVEAPEIRFDTIAHSAGIETIEKARS
jgi:quinol monooxygenase YgiN